MKMASNRKLPFGYRMEFGEIVIHPLEAITVQKVFRQYASGASYKELVDMLREQVVSYDSGRLWNKNVVARILENRKYIGDQGWPAIIPEEQYDRAREKRSGKAAIPKKTAAQKLLRRLSGCHAAQEYEQAVLRLLNRVIADPGQICAPPVPAANIAQIGGLRQALRNELERQPVDETAAKNLALELAYTRYAAIGNQEYETMRLRQLFERYAPMDTLDAELLRSAVSAVRMRRGKVILRLKNGQIIEGSQSP